MKKIFETLKKKWAEYLLEIFVIIIGIIGAFMLNNWHEQRVERNFEQKMLTELHASLQDNIQYLDRGIRANEQAAKSCRLILDYFDNGHPYNDSLSSHFSQSLFWFYPSLTNNAYESLKSYGLHLITNDSIRDQLGDIYEWKFIQRLSLRQDDYFYGTVAPLLPAWFDSYDFYREMRPLNFEDLRRSKEYRHILKTMISNRWAQNLIFKESRQDRIKLAEMIKIELTKKRNHNHR